MVRFVKALVWGTALAAALGCGKQPETTTDPVTVTMTLGSQKTTFSSKDQVKCQTGLNGTTTNGSGSGNATIEFRSYSHSFSVTLRGFTYGDSRTASETVDQGDASGQVSFSTPSSAYSTGLQPSGTDKGKCVVQLQYGSPDRFQVSCSNVLGTNGDKVSAVITGSCS